MSPAQRRREAHAYRRSASKFVTVIMSIGLAFSVAGAVGAWRGYATRSWPTTQAVLMTNNLEQGTQTRRVPATEKQRGGVEEKIATETLTLAYRYTVDGTTFEGQKLEPWDFGLPAKAKAHAVAVLTPGTTHPVAYDARDPRRSYLLPGPSTTALTLLTLGLVLMAVGLIAGRVIRRA